MENMEIVPIENLGVAVEILFPKPLGFTQAAIEEFGSKVCDATDGLSLRPDQIRLRRTDDLYNYELNAQFFGENGWLVRTADRVKFGVRNARTVTDRTLILQLIHKLYLILRMDPKSITALQVGVLGRFPSDDERDAYMNRFSYSPLIARAAGLGYVRVNDWAEEIKVTLDSTGAPPCCMVLQCDTKYENSQHWETFLGTIPSMVENAANLFDLGFEPLRTTV